MVKFGYVPVTVVVPAPVKATVWSGAVFVIVNVPDDVIGEPLTEIPVPAVAATLVTVPLPLLLKVFQSVLDKYPSVAALDCEMLIAGVAPPEEAIGEVPVTLVTVPLPLLLKVFQSVELK
jgi:hypothetical protein